MGVHVLMFTVYQLHKLFPLFYMYFIYASISIKRKPKPHKPSVSIQGSVAAMHPQTFSKSNFFVRKVQKTTWLLALNVTNFTF